MWKFKWDAACRRYVFCCAVSQSQYFICVSALIQFKNSVENVVIFIISMILSFVRSLKLIDKGSALSHPRQIHKRGRQYGAGTASVLPETPPQYGVR